MPAETEKSSPGSETITRRRTMLLAGATGLALTEILTHADLSPAKKHKNKKNQHKKCQKQCKKAKKQCDKDCEFITDVDLCKNDCAIAQKQCKKVC